MNGCELTAVAAQAEALLLAAARWKFLLSTHAESVNHSGMLLGFICSSLCPLFSLFLYVQYAWHILFRVLEYDGSLKAFQHDAS